ncbi:CRAL-TRIO domain-containing protein [Peziza echinospora]|nr:CRAL-TRIO domain-containing protein [Peziza echinospora]
MATTITADLYAGHLGHLTPAQETAFAQFKEKCAEKGIYTPEEEGVRNASHDDAELLRFLRARKFVVADAVTQFSDAEAWRKKEGIEDIYDNFDVDEYEASRKLHPQWTGQRSKDGLPIYVYAIRHITGPTYNEYTASKNKMQRLTTLYENMTRFVLPLCTAAHYRELANATTTTTTTNTTTPPTTEETTTTTTTTPTTTKPVTPISSLLIITDISQVTLWQFWSLKGHMQESSRIASERYPETLLKQYIIGAPSFFPTVWGWIKKWFDPVTVAKITILPGNMSKPEMGKALGEVVEASKLPREYGGELEWEYGMKPVLERELLEVAGLGEGEEGVLGPMKWVDGGNGGRRRGEGRVVKVGTVGGKRRDAGKE